ncbi:MAG TPA: DMT family transporter [Candidatus Limnocylindrales bacterium]|nr:DMT family transporter [Candidatus Limnocylindrales bacterium]
MLVTLFWAANFIVVKAANQQIPPITFALLRFGLAAIVLLLALRLVEGGAHPPRGDGLVIAGLGALGFGVYQVIWSTALQWIPAGDSALLIAATPVGTALLAVVAGSDVLTRRKLLGGLVSFLGVGIVVTAGSGLGLGFSGGSLSSTVLLGDALTLAAALCWSVYTAFGAPHLRRHSPLRTTAWAMVGGCAVLLLPGLWEATSANWSAVSPGAWGGLLYSAILPAGLANVLVFNAIRLVGPTRVTAYQFLVPFIAVVLGALFLAEPIRTAQIAGGAVIVGGVALTRVGSLDVAGWLRELIPD